ncbi:hypothetical protein CPB86DRAFT_783486 [Serendipita vermifera]|nr:hypothetical protein CPB86DRAFT_783486 [Serendipita vermifera]
MHSICVLGGSTSRAVRRVPLEIWTIILVYAISYPIIPSLEDQLFAIVDYFEHDCKLFQGNRHARTQLRLVCKLWNEIIKPHLRRIDHWRGTKPSTIPPSCSRVELVKPNQRWSRRRPWKTCRCLGSSPSTPFREMLKEEVTLIRYPAVVALLDHEATIKSFKEILRLFPNLRLFSTQSHIEWSPQSLSGLLHNIAYLQLPAHLSYCDIKEDTCMPNLQTLSLIYTDSLSCYESARPSGRTHRLFGSKGLFPSLVNLEVTGEVESGRRFPFQELNLLFENVGSTLEHLSYMVRREGNQIPERFPKEFWKHCTRIKTVYGYFTQLTEKLPLEYSYGSVQLILRDFSKPTRHWYDTQALLYVLSFIWATDRSLKASFGSFAMDIDWCTLFTQLTDKKDLAYLSLISWFLHKFKQADQDLRDKSGEGLGSNEAKKCIAWLNSAVPDPSKHLHSAFYRK